MLTAIEGYVKNGQMVINEHISAYGERTEWGQNVEAYMEEMRGNDRLS